MNFSKPPGSRFSRRAPRTLPTPVLQAVHNAKKEILEDPLERLRSVERKIKSNRSMPPAVRKKAMGKLIQLQKEAASKANKAIQVDQEDARVVEFTPNSIADDANKIADDANNVAQNAKTKRTKRIVFALIVIVVVVLIVRSKKN
jgi:hypothetical protein